MREGQWNQIAVMASGLEVDPSVWLSGCTDTIAKEGSLANIRASTNLVIGVSRG